MEKDQVDADKAKKKETETVKQKSVKLKANGNSLAGRKPLDNIEINPQLDSTKQVTEQSRGGVVLTFGRMNPPTVGHEKLVNKVKDVARSKNATPLVYLSHSQDKKKNPLEYEDKVRFAKAAFGKVVQHAPQKTLIDILKTLQTKFSEVTLVVGSDRVDEFETLLNKYNKKDYTFEKINVVSAGERDPDAQGVSGMSASKMRAAVQAGDQSKFVQGLPRRLHSIGKQVYELIHAGMEIHEQLEQEGLLAEFLDLQQRRKRALVMKRFAPRIKRARELAQRKIAGDTKLKKRAMIQARNIIRKRVAGRRGAEYASLTPGEKIQVDIAVEKRKKIIGKIAKRLLPKVKQAEFQRMRSFMQGHQMEPKHTGLVSIQKESSDELNTIFAQYAQGVDTTTVNDVLEEMTNLVLDKIITEKQIAALEKRSQRTGIEYDIIEQVYVRGLLDTYGDVKAAFNRVNAFCCGGKTAMTEDADLYKLVSNGQTDLDRTNENFLDGKGPGRPGDSARHGLKGKSAAELRKIRSSDSASPRKKQLAHFMLNMTKNESANLNEDLRKWFDQKWVRMNTKGEIKGDCAREEGEGKPKCLPQAKALAMDKDDRALAVRRKRREDPVADRQGKGGKPVNVATEAYITEKNSPTNPALWSRAKSLARQKFDVYPSAYANGWASKWYKSKGGGWKSANESYSDINDVFESKNKPYVKPHYGSPNPQKQTAWKASNKHGKVKYFGLDFRNSAHKHAGINENFLDELSSVTVNAYRRGKTVRNCVPEEVAIPDDLKKKLEKIANQLHKSVAAHARQRDVIKSLTSKDKKDIKESLDSDHYKALTDIELNTKNRDMTTQKDGYGPLNPLDEKGSKKFWDEKAKMWKTTVEAAKEARCGNCAFFNQSPPVMKKIADGIGERGETVSELAGFGFCELWEFKCAALRTCNTWVLGGPIKEDVNIAFEELAAGSKVRRNIDATPRTKLDRKKIAYVSRPDNTRDQGQMNQQRQAHSKVFGEEGNKQSDPRKRLMGTDELVKAYKADTPGQSLESRF